MSSEHAHISTESADCDGQYSRTNVLVPDATQDEWGFRAETIGNALAYVTEGADVTFSVDGFSVSYSTDEGYVFSEFTWCTDDDTDTRSTFRDHRAESMGY